MTKSARCFTGKNISRTVLFSSTLLVFNTTAIAIAEDRQLSLTRESLQSEETIQTSFSDLPLQATPTTPISPTTVEPDIRFSNNYHVSSSVHQMIATETNNIDSKEERSTSFISTRAQDLLPQPNRLVSQISEAEIINLEEESSTISAQNDDLSADSLKIPARFGAQFSTSSAGLDAVVGVNAFIPLQQTASEDITFLEGDIQLMDGEPNFSLNLGHRGYISDQDIVRGGYIGIDSRSTDSSTFYQVATGYERLGDDWDFRINGYFPIGNRTNTIQDIDIDTGLQTSSGFQGNQLVLSAVRERQRILQQENTLGGFDAEMGTELADWDGGELMGYVGGYLLSGEESSLGGQLRIAANFESNFNAGLALQHDALFDTSVVFSIRASWPNVRFQDDDDAEFQEEYEVPIRLRDPIARRSSVAVNVIEESEIVFEEDIAPLRNPEEEEDYRFVHVDLAAGAGTGDGTYESPFGTVEQAIALINSDADTYSDGNTVVYVDGENSPTITIPGFTIPDRVRVLSQGPEQTIAGMPFPGFSEQATRLPFSATQNFNVSNDDPNANGIAVTLPDSNDGVFPTITGGASPDLVTLGNSTVLAGFQIQDAANHGVIGSQVTNVELRNNLIENSGGSGIFLDDVGGNAILFDNEINNSIERGILVENTLTDQPIEVAIAGFDLNNNRVGMEFTATATDTEFPSQRIVIGPSTTANTSVGTPDGIPLTNSILNSTDEGIVIEATGTSLLTSANQEFSLFEATVDSSGITTGASGIRLLADNGAHTQEFTVTNSTISNNGGDGIEVVNGRPPAGPTQTASAQEIVVRDTMIANNDGNGIDILLADASVQELVIRGNEIVANTGDGIRSLAQTVSVQEWRADAETGDAGISENIISGNGGQAIVINLNDVAVLPIVSVVNNDLTDNGAGADLEITSTSTPGSLAACLIISDNQAPFGIQLTGADPSLTGGIPSVLVQDLSTLLADPDVTFLAVDFFGNTSPSTAPFQNETNRCIP